MEKRKFLRLRLKIRLSCSDLHYIFHILNSIGGPLGPMVQTSPSAQSDRSRTIKKIIKPVWTNGPLDRSGPVVLSLGADHRAPCLSSILVFLSSQMSMAHLLGGSSIQALTCRSKDKPWMLPCGIFAVVRPERRNVLGWGRAQVYLDWVLGHFARSCRSRRRHLNWMMFWVY